MKVAVVGAGAAGTAAAWAARRAGADVTVLHERAGASALSSGAADDEPWETHAPARELSGEERELLALLGFRSRQGSLLVATSAGVIRPARAADSAVLDLSELAGKRIAVADVVRDDWDGRLVARALSSSAFARKTATRFEAIELDLGDVRALPAWDLAARFDEAAEREKLRSELAKARGERDAWLFGPWLGCRPGTADALRQEVGLALGEVLSAPGGAAGARFEAARDALLEAAKIPARLARVLRVKRDGSGFVLELESGDPLSVEQVVLATGGMIASGVLLDPARPAHAGGACFHPSLEAPVSLEVGGEPVDAVSTLHGVDFAAHGVELVERVGIATEGGAARGAPGIFVAGDAIADRPRTFLRALASGIRAGKLAAAPHAS